MRFHAVLGILLLLCLPTLAAAACTAQQLEDELLADTMSLGYAAYVASGNDAALYQLLVTVREGAPYVVSKGIVSKDTAMGTWADIISGIPFIADATIRTRWTWLIETLFLQRSTVDYSDALTEAFFAQMVADGLMTSAAIPITSEVVTARTTRQGSRAEVLCGILATDVVRPNHISCALRDTGCE